MKRKNNVYGYRDGDTWVRRVSIGKHLFRAYQAFGFHLHFKTLFQDKTLKGCRITDEESGTVWYISREDFLEKAQYITKPKPQYIVPLAAFTVASIASK